MELPSEAAAEKKQFLREGIQSVIAVPVMAGFSVMGFIGFESVRSQKKWTENIIALLKIVGELFSFALSRKEATEALRDSESKYKALYEYANDAIFLIKGEQFVECNTKTLQMFGCAEGQILGHSPLEFSPPYQPNGKDSREEILGRWGLALSGQPQFFEWKHMRHDGALFDAEVSLIALMWATRFTFRLLCAILPTASSRKRNLKARWKTSGRPWGPPYMRLPT